jgi:polysaccharide deacetylase 2 family uncharacterized protein YibQ
MDRKLNTFVNLLHKSAAPRPGWRRRLPWRGLAEAIMVAALIATGAALWSVWPGTEPLLRQSEADVPKAAPTAPAGPPPSTAPAARALTLAQPAIEVPSTELGRADVLIPPPAQPAPPRPSGPRVVQAQVARPPPVAVEPIMASAADLPIPPVPPLTAMAPRMLPAPTPKSQSAPEGATIPAWVRYSVAAPAKDARPWIAVVIDDLGVDKRRTDRTIALSGPLTLSFLAYATDLPRQAEAARKAGHELLVHVPMQPLEPLARGLDTGPNDLEVGMSRADILQRLRWDLARFDGYVGINNHMGSRFTSDRDSMRPVVEELRERGLLFLDSRTVARSSALDLAREYGVPNAGRDVFLDNELSSPAITTQLAELERVARHTGMAIGIGHPHDETLDALQRWLRELASKGMQLVPVSAIVRERGAAG